MEDNIQFNRVSLKPFKTEWLKYFTIVLCIDIFSIVNYYLNFLLIPRIKVSNIVVFILIGLISFIFYKYQSKQKKVFESSEIFEKKIKAFTIWRRLNLILGLVYNILFGVILNLEKNKYYLFSLIFFMVFYFLSKPNKLIFEKLLKEEIMFEE